MKLVRRNVGETTEARSEVSGGIKLVACCAFHDHAFSSLYLDLLFFFRFFSFLTICRGDFVILQVSLQKIDIEAVYLVG